MRTSTRRRGSNPHADKGRGSKTVVFADVLYGRPLSNISPGLGHKGSMRNTSSDHTNLYTGHHEFILLIYVYTIQLQMQRQNIQSIVTSSVTLTVTNNTLR